MTYDNIITTMHIDGDRATLDVGALDWNRDLLDQIDWNDIAGQQADDIMCEAFGRAPERDDNCGLHETEWLDVQRAWPEIPSGTVSVGVVRDADGTIDERRTAERLDRALSDWLEENACAVSDEWRAQEIERLRAVYPRLVEER